MALPRCAVGNLEPMLIDHHTPTDRDLLAGCDDDPALFSALYRRYSHRLLGFFYGRTACAETAADLTAETFAAVYLGRRDFRGDGDASAWVFGIAHHLLARYVRRGATDERARRRLGVETPQLDDESLRRIEDSDALDTVRPALTAGLGTLSRSERDALVLRVVDGKPYDEIAAALGCTSGAARVRVARALKRLRAHLEESVPQGDHHGTD